MNKRVTSCWAETYGATNNPAQGVPSPFVEPIKELVEAIGGEMMCWSVVEPEVMQKKKKGLLSIKQNNHTQNKHFHL